jgi:RNA polymerase sigma-70 factor (ECF subfamily)
MTNKELDNCIIDFLNGDESSFDLLYHETKKSVYLSIYAIVKEKNTIEDLMQDTYMKAIKSLDYYTLGTNFKAWISRIARNNALNYVKRKNREEIIDSDERPDVFGTTSENYFLDFATRSLTEIEKDIVIYKIVLDLKFREIAEVMELPLGTVYWNYKNAINKMKEEIRE